MVRVVIQSERDARGAIAAAKAIHQRERDHHAIASL